MKTAQNPHVSSGPEESGVKTLLHYLLIVLFYVGLFFLVSFISQAMPGGRVSGKADITNESTTFK